MFQWLVSSFSSGAASAADNAFSNVPEPEVDASTPLGKLQAYVHQRCGGEFSPDAIRELYQFLRAYIDNIDASRLYLGGVGPQRAIYIPLRLRTLVAPSTGGVAQFPIITPLFVRIPSGYRDPHAGSRPIDEVQVRVMVNVPPDQRVVGAPGALNPRAIFVDPATYEIMVPQCSSSLVAYIKEIEVRCQRAPPVPGIDPSSPTVVQFAPGQFQIPSQRPLSAATPAPFYGSNRSPQEMASVIRSTADRLYHTTPAQIPGPGPDFICLETFVPCFIRGARSNVKVVLEINANSPVAYVRARVVPPRGCILDSTVGSPCDREGYVEVMDTSVWQRALSSALPSQRYDNGSAYLNELRSVLSAHFPYIETSNSQPTAAYAANGGSVPGVYNYPSGASTTTAASDGGTSRYPTDPAPPDNTSSLQSSSTRGQRTAASPDGIPDVEPLGPNARATRPTHYSEPSLATNAARAFAANNQDTPRLESSTGSSQQTQRPQPSSAAAGPAVVEPSAWRKASRSRSTSEAPASPPTPTSAPEEEEMCAVCLDAPRTFVCVPCGHRVLCGACKDRFTTAGSQCPTCRAALQTVIRVYL
jgi:hypothetical protein